MSVNRLGLGNISLPSTMDKDLKVAIEDLIAKTSDNINYLMKPTIKSVAANATLSDLDSVVLVNATSGAKTITLPSAATVTGKQLKIKKTDASANAVTVTPSGSQKIDGAANYSLATQNKLVCIVSDGSNWFIVANN